MDGVALKFLVIGLVGVGFGLPLVGRRVPPNRWYGVRTPKTLADPAVWYDANAIGGRDLALAGAAVALTAVATGWLATGMPPETVALVNIVVFGAAMVAATVHTFAALRRM